MMKTEYNPHTNEVTRTLDSWDLIWMGGLLLAVIFFVGLGYLVISGFQNQVRLMAQCRADGHKEYECVSMLRQNSNTFIMMTR